MDAYLGLNLYVRVMSAGAEFPREEAEYLLTVSQPPAARYPWPSPGAWYRHSDLLSVGQRAAISDWEIRIACAMEVLNRENHEYLTVRWYEM